MGDSGREQLSREDRFARARGVAVRAAREWIASTDDGPTVEALSGPPHRIIALGDPQTRLDTFLAVLDRAELLSDEGRLIPDVALISLGDHFDWGRRTERLEATEEAILLLAWLASHPANQVTILLGNHDLARVCELAPFDLERFRDAQREADLAYDSGDPRRTAEFKRRYPEIPDSEVLARDLATFSLEQRVLVAHLLRRGRFRIAQAAAPNVLCLHGAVAHDDLALLGLPHESMSSAELVAERLNAELDDAVNRWAATFSEESLASGIPQLDLGALHRPADGESEGRGIFYQRPTHPLAARPELFVGPPRRRFDPRTLPLGLTQVVGHIRDKKARELLGAWTDHRRPSDGLIRHLVTDGRAVRYAFGLPPTASGHPRATLIFADAGMNFVPPERYPLLDLTSGIVEF
ncbi:MAG: metallophosphoesterase [Candidatus Eisenbacteria bacterium]